MGFLGATGAGKSALVNLIPRFYDVTEGSITIDGVDVRDVPQDNLRQIVGIALQEAVLFQGDLRFNLKFGAPQVEDDVMFEAAKAADSYGFVNNIPQKWEAPVAQRGANFSGGQRQRLSITRALTTQPKVLHPGRQHQRPGCLHRRPRPGGHPRIHGQCHHNCTLPNASAP